MFSRFKIVGSINYTRHRLGTFTHDAQCFQKLICEIKGLKTAVIVLCKGRAYTDFKRTERIYAISMLLTCKCGRKRRGRGCVCVCVCVGGGDRACWGEGEVTLLPIHAQIHNYSLHKCTKTRKMEWTGVL